MTGVQTCALPISNNVVNAGAMTIGSAVVAALSGAGVTAEQLLLVVVAMCGVSAWIAQKLHRACD